MNVSAVMPPWAAPAAPASSAPESVTPPPIIAPPLNSVSTPPLHSEPSKKSSKLPLILVLLFLFCVGGVGALYFFGKGRLIASAREKLRVPGEEAASRSHVFGETAAQNANTAARSNVQIASVTTTRPLTATPVAAQPAPQPNPPVPPTTAIAAAKPSLAPAPAPAPHPPVHFPPLRLQSIFYRPGNASVMINGKTLFVGDEISGVNIADIQASSVTLVLSGQTNILTLR
jgi:hypothetical protein